MHRGQLIKWDNAKGFGFIKSDELSNDTFIHISSLKHMSRKPKQGDYIHFEIEKHQGKNRATNARIEGVKSIEFKTRKVVKNNSAPRFGNKLVFIAVIIGVSVFTYNRLNLSTISETPQIPNKTVSNKKTQANKPARQYKCDGRQYCSEMTSRAEAEFFIRHCPDTKMDGDNDGIPCENDSRF